MSDTFLASSSLRHSSLFLLEKLDLWFNMERAEWYDRWTSWNNEKKNGQFIFKTARQRDPIQLQHTSTFNQYPQSITEYSNTQHQVPSTPQCHLKFQPDRGRGQRPPPPSISCCRSTKPSPGSPHQPPWRKKIILQYTWSFIIFHLPWQACPKSKRCNTGVLHRCQIWHVGHLRAIYM